jgi:hypothetical protein
MKLHALDIPDDPARVPRWLERHLVGLDLAELVAELEAVHGPTAASPMLGEVLGSRREAVLASGLSALPPHAIGQLLRRPRLLLELQEMVLASGGGYWNRVGPPSDELASRVERGRRSLPALLSGASPGAAPAGPILTPARPVAWYRHPAFVSLATAASVLALVVVHERTRPVAPITSASVGWGWSRPGALPQDQPPASYLDHLADAAEDWFQTRPDDPLALARRIAEFRQGCSVLILAPHRPLSPADRAWLIEKCRAWAAKLDANLAAVEAGEDPLRVRDEADATIQGLIGALRERARSSDQAGASA